MTLSFGARGDDVKKLQQQLNASGYKLDTDGVFGNQTLSAVKDFQGKNGLQVDGVVGSQTAGKLNAGGTVSTQPVGNSVQSSTPKTLADYDAGYTPSAAVQAAQEYLNQIQSQKPGEYQSPYAAQLDAMYEQIVGRQPFEYDMNTDQLYQQYRDQYTRLGKRAMEDTMGQAAGLTGGFGSTYSQNAGQQAYQNYLDQLNDRVPELYQLALNKYQMEGDDMYKQYGLLSDRENTAYGRYRDLVGDWRDDYSMAYNRYGDERNFDYGTWGDMRNYLYQKERDRIADEQWERQFAATQAARAAALRAAQEQGDTPKQTGSIGITTNKRAESAEGMGTTSYTNLKRSISASLAGYGSVNNALNMVSSSWKNLNNEQRKELKTLLSSYGYKIED